MTRMPIPRPIRGMTTVAARSMSRTSSKGRFVWDLPKANLRLGIRRQSIEQLGGQWNSNSAKRGTIYCLFRS